MVGTLLEAYTVAAAYRSKLLFAKWHDDVVDSIPT